jgi:hypothetical protein
MPFRFLFPFRIRCDKDAKFGGIVFLRDISQCRRDQKLIAKALMKSLSHKISRNFVFVTTHWVNPETKVLEDRERQLQEAWRETVPECQMARFMNTPESAWRVVENLLDRPPVKMFDIQKKLDKSSGKGLGNPTLESTV